jgi:hypothetical protein
VSYRVYTVVFAGITNIVVVIVLIFTPLLSSEMEIRHQVPRRGHPVHLLRSEMVVLPSSSIAGGWPFCTRWAPDGIIGGWHPSTAQIDTLEVDLAYFIPTIETTFSWWHNAYHHPPLETYHRQYAGITLLLDDPMILVGGFMIPPEGWKLHGGWRRSFVDVCDGGALTWSLVYDPRSREFYGFTFGGD